MKRNIVYIIAAIVAIVAAVGLFYMFRTQTAEAPEPVVVEEVRTVEMTDIVVSTKKIPYGTQITSDMLKTKQVPVSEKDSNMIARADQAVGAYANRTIDADQTIFNGMLDEPQTYISGTNGLSYEIPEGMVAIAVSAAELEGVAGYLTRGDVVNILADAKAIKAAMEGIEFYREDITPVNLAYLVKNVTILAVGDKQYDEYMARGGRSPVNDTRSSGEQTGTAENEADGSTYDCVILCLDEFSAQLVVEVLQTSRLTFALKHRDFGKHDVTRPELAMISQNFYYARPETVQAG